MLEISIIIVIGCKKEHRHTGSASIDIEEISGNLSRNKIIKTGELNPNFMYMLMEIGYREIRSRGHSGFSG